MVQSVERGEPVRVTAKLLSIFGREALGRVLIIGISPLGWFNSSPRMWGSQKPDQGPRVPVLLIPGYGTNWSALWFLCQFLGHRGWTWLWPTNHAGRAHSLAFQGEALSRKILDLKRKTGAPRVDIVAFSMGGLIAAWYLRHQDGAEHVRRLVTVGTPWRGTKMAVFARNQSGQDLIYGSHMLDDLTPPPVPTICIWSPDDPVVIPATSAAPEGIPEVCIDGAGHLDMMLSARVFRAVQAALSHPVAGNAS